MDKRTPINMDVPGREKASDTKAGRKAMKKGRDYARKVIAEDMAKKIDLKNPYDPGIVPVTGRGGKQLPQKKKKKKSI